jgi:putative SOS response-associated peptidase YedK
MAYLEGVRIVGLHRHGRRDGQEMLVAGIWDGWRAPDGSIPRSFAVITTDANETLLPIHHRMPVIIDPKDVEIWLGDDVDAAAVLMRPARDDVLRAWRVSRAVNDVRRDEPELLEPVELDGAVHPAAGS